MPDSLPYDDKELLQRIAKKDEAVFKKYFEKHYRQLVYFADEILDDLSYAQDVAADAFVKLWNKKEIFTSEAHLKNFLFLSVKHSCIDLIRSRKVHNKAHFDLQYLNDQVEECAEKAMTESEIMKNITEQIANLPEQCRKIFSHIYFDGMSTNN